MSQESRVRGVLRPSILIGSAVWLALALASFAPRVHLGIIEVLFLLGPWIVVPLGADLVRGARNSKSTAVRDCVVFPAALLTSVSFFLDNRIAAAWFASSWLLVCAGFAGDGVRRLVSSETRSFPQFCFAAGEGYLLVAGAWLVASRAGLQLLAFREPIVLLTAVHFHFAGFGSAVLAGLVDANFVGNRGHRELRAALLAVVLGPAILGLAFLLGPKVKLVAALLIVLGQFGLAGGMVRAGFAAKNAGGRWLLFVAGGSVAAGMILAVVWALGEYPLQAFVNIRQMAEFHGVLNAIGFVVCGLLGWSVVSTRNGECGNGGHPQA
jgi:YndJ-like protein